MERLLFTCEWITPALWGGADPKAEPEIRSASLKGLLRYWWRVFIQGCRFLPLPELAKREAALFGTTESASPFVVRAYPIGEAKSVSVDLQKGAIREPAYFLFPFRQQRRLAWKDGGKFKVEILPRPGAKVSAEGWKEMQASFWLLAHLGGIGTRSRRGFGSFEVVEVEADSFLRIQADTVEKYGDALREGIKALHRDSGCDASQKRHTEIPALHPSLATIAIWKHTHATWSEALQKVAESMNIWRRRHQLDYNHIKKALSGSQSTLDLPIDRIGFGLPIVFYFRSLGGKNGVLQAEKRDSSPSTYSRRASPLWLRVVRLMNNRYTVQALFLQAQLLPAEAQLLLKWKGGTSLSGLLSNSYQKQALEWVQEWLNSSNWHPVLYDRA